LIGPSHKKVETAKASQNKRFYGKMVCLSLWPTYIGEKGRTLGKTYGIKQGAIGNTHEEHIGNLGNMKGTYWEQRKNEKKNPPLPQPKT
jgi:hypothetical protein